MLIEQTITLEKTLLWPSKVGPHNVITPSIYQSSGPGHFLNTHHRGFVFLEPSQTVMSVE